MAPCACKRVKSLIQGGTSGSPLPQCTPEGTNYILRKLFHYSHSLQFFKIIFKIYRSTHEVVEIDNFLYSFGGNDGSASLNSMERYDIKLNKWVLVTSMSSRRSSVGGAVLECLGLEKIITETTNKLM